MRFEEVKNVPFTQMIDEFGNEVQINPNGYVWKLVGVEEEIIKLVAVLESSVWLIPSKLEVYLYSPEKSLGDDKHVYNDQYVAFCTKLDDKTLREVCTMEEGGFVIITDREELNRFALEFLEDLWDELNNAEASEEFCEFASKMCANDVSIYPYIIGWGN